jgi:Family of unknown function (DUF6731)
MSKNVKFDFFKVTMPDGTDLDAGLQKVHGMKNDKTRTLDLGGRHVRLQESEFGHGLWEFEMLHIRMDGIPAKASLDGAIEVFDLDDDEGIGEESAFVYHVGTKTLVVQRNKFGVSSGTLGRYFEKLLCIQDKIEIDPLIQEGALARILRHKK